jgi:acetyl-CoA C-acetyltransferase
MPDSVFVNLPDPNLGDASLDNVAGSVILSAARTPFGRFGGGLRKYSAVDLGAAAAREAIVRSKIDPGAVDYVVMGQVIQAGAGQIPSRQVQIAAGLDRSIGSETINKVCASGMRAVTLADQMIRAGDYDVVLAGGMESMTNAPYLLPQARFGYKYGNAEFVDALIRDGLSSTFDGLHMVEQASKVSRELEITREDQDAWALRSHERAVAAQESGALSEEIVQVGEVEHDEAPRADTSIEKLAKLDPVFDPEGTTTAGNAPGLNDGAAALLVASETWAEANGHTPLARIVGTGVAADDFAYLARTPALAAQKTLESTGVSIDQVDRIEINEAFASVAVHSHQLLGADAARVNVNGGAIALGHPIGASGARLLVTLVHELRRAGGRLGLAAICSGGGQGDAVLLEV